MAFELKSFLRPNIAALKPYSSARDEYTGKEGVFLDANENPIKSLAEPGFNRYPDPLQKEVKDKIAEIKNVRPTQIFLGNGSDEPIDLLYRAFCEPKIDKVVQIAPTYGMYKVCADINGTEIVDVLLTDDYQIDLSKTLAKISETQPKLVFICSPNNPTGNALATADILKIVSSSNALIVVDEAYIDFSEEPSFLSYLNSHPNLIVLQTFSKAWGMAALRLGMAFASEEIINVLNSIKYPYNINQATQNIALQALKREEEKNEMVKEILTERERLENEFQNIDCITKVYPSDSNMILVKTIDAKGIYNYLIEKLVIVRDRSKVVLCEGALRITIGTKQENDLLIDLLNKY